MSGAFTEAELMPLAAHAHEIRRGERRAIPKAALTILLALCALFSGIVEYAVAYEVFAYFKAPLPGESGSWSIPLLSLTGVLMALALHLHASEHPDSFAVRALRRGVSVLVPVYALGAGAALAAILYFDGADALFSVSSGAELFATATEETGSPLMEWLAPHLALIFVLGCGGLAIINLYIFHKLLSLITANARDITGCLLAAREAREALQEIETRDREYAELSRKREALTGQDPRTSEFALANEIVALIHRSLAPAEKYLTQEQLRLNSPVNRFEVRDGTQTIDLKELQKRVASIKGINAKTIAAAFRAEHEPRSKS